MKTAIILHGICDRQDFFGLDKQLLTEDENMKTAAILHGRREENKYFGVDVPSPSNSHWLPWLQRQFLRHGVLCQNPEMPRPYQPVYADWKSVFERFDLDADSIVVGHSAGGGFLLKWLSENANKRFAKVVLVAPWLDPRRQESEFLQFDLDPAIQARTELHILASDNDDPDIAASIDKIVAACPKARVHPFSKFGHFCFSDMGTVEFPALWDICKSDNG